MKKTTKVLAVIAGVVVLGGVATESVFLVRVVNIANQAVAVASAAEAKIAEVKDGKDGENGVDGAKGEKGDAGADGKNGLDGLDGHDGRDGIDGKDGKGVVSAVINEDGHLVITYTDGTVSDLGKVTGNNGKDGKDGAAGATGEKGDKGDAGNTGADGKDGIGINSAIVNEDGDLIITLTDGSVVNAGHVVGKDGVDGKDGKDADNSLSDKKNDIADDTNDNWYTPSEVYDAIKSTARMVSKPALNDVGLKGYVAGYSDSLLYVSTAKFSSYTEATKDSTSYLEISTSTNFCTDPSLGMSIGQEINVIVDDVICSQNGNKKCLFATVDTLAVLDGDVVNDVSNRKLTTL